MNVVCSVCDSELPQAEAVGINGRWHHVECFSVGLKRALEPVRGLEDLAIDVNNVAAIQAYRLGAQSMGVLLAKRRKARKQRGAT